MPRIKRWFPVSHDINSDPEVWTMRREIGEKSLSVWLEFLSIGDRNDGEIPGDLQELIRSIAGKCQATVRTVTLTYQFAISRLWLDCQATLRLSNYSKYHRSSEPKPLPSYPDPTEPDLIKINTLVDDPPKPQLKLAVKPDMSVQEFVESWNEIISPVLPAVIWPLAPSRARKAAARLKEHPDMQFWERVFANTLQSDFLAGKKTAWRATFDFLVANDANCLKIYEGGYSNAQNEARRSSNGYQQR